MAIDRSNYFTHQHAGEFHIDWISFYDQLDATTARARQELVTELDLSYGEAEKQKLDVYRSEGEIESSAVFIFIHGGGFIEGDRAHYGGVALPFSKHGIVTVVPSYRLAPESHYPDQPEDIKDVVEWVYKNINSLGGDPQRIYLGGHSAGAILAVDLTVKTEWLEERGLPQDLIKGSVPISGPYDAADPAIGGYLGRPEDRHAASPLHHVRSAPPWTLVAIGSKEDPWMGDNQEITRLIQALGEEAELLVLDDMDHDETALTLCEEDGELFQAILRMMG